MCTIEEVTFDPADWDKPLGDLLIQVEGDTQRFLSTVFGFLKRRTNFFKGEDPQKRVLDALHEVRRVDGLHKGASPPCRGQRAGASARSS